MDRLIAMHVFVRVAETGTFSAVARERNTTQSAISKLVAALEQHLGVRLLTRSTRALALTDDGRRYFEQARRLVAEVAEVELQLRHGTHQLEGTMRIAAPVGFGLRVMMPLVKRFLADHPQVRIDLRLHDHYIDLVEQGIDMAVRIGHLSDSALIARSIGRSQGTLMASASYPAALSAPNDLLLHSCIVYTELSSKNVWHFSHADGREVAIAVTGALQSNSSEVVRAALLDGMGIAYAPSWMATQELAEGRVRALLPEWVIAPLPINLVWPKHRQQVARVRAFADFLGGALADSGGAGEYRQNAQ